MVTSEPAARSTAAHRGSLALATVGLVYAGWLVFIYDRPRYDTPCGSIAGPRRGSFGWDTLGTCGVTHWWSAGLAAYCVVAAGAFAVTGFYGPGARRLVLLLTLSVAIGSLLVLTLIAHVYPEPVLGEAWTAARDQLALVVAFQALAAAAMLATADRPVAAR